MKILTYIFSILIIWTELASAGTVHNINKGTDYTTIQTAIDDANIGDEIHVDSGTYYENILINKRLTLKGIDTGNGKPIVDANIHDDAVILFANSIIFDGFNIINWTNIGINVSSKNNVIKDNNVISSTTYTYHVPIGIYMINTDNNLLFNNTVSNNDHGIVVMKGINNTIINNAALYNKYSGIGLWYSSNSVIKNNIIKENTEADIGISSGSDESCNNVIENNIGSGDRPIGYYNYPVSLQNSIFSELILCNADNSVISNIIIDGSPTKDNNGFYIYKTDNSNFTGIISSNNYHGIYLEQSSYNTITNGTILDNSGGIIIESSSNNIVTNNNILNGGSGIFLDYASNNNFLNNNISNNWNGIFLNYANNNNNFMRNIINYTGGNGIFIASSTGNIFSKNTISLSGNYGMEVDYSSNNVIYDNYFNNIHNFSLSVSPNNNFWNTARVLTANIIEGPYIGGNFWANPSNTGFSQTCTNRGDGFCNSSYILDSSNIDYLPLTNNPSTCGNTPEGQNIQTFPMTNIDMIFNSVAQCGDTIASISDNQWGPFPDNYNSIKIYNISTTAIYTNSVTVNISYLDSDIPPEINESSIKLFHYENGNWIDITTFLDTNPNTITGMVTSLSPFAIVGESTITSTVTPMVTPTTSPTETTATVTMNTVKGSSFDYIGLIILSICLIIVSILMLRKR